MVWLERPCLTLAAEQASLPWRRSDKEHLPASELTSRRLRFTRLTSSLGNPAPKIERSSKSQTRLRLNTPPTSSRWTRSSAVILTPTLLCRPPPALRPGLRCLVIRETHGRCVHF